MCPMRLGSILKLPKWVAAKKIERPLTRTPIELPNHRVELSCSYVCVCVCWCLAIFSDAIAQSAVFRCLVAEYRSSKSDQFQYSVRVENTHDDMPWDRFARRHVIVVGYRQLDDARVRKVSTRYYY